MTNKKQQHGFTLIELLLAMAFIAFLLLFIVTVILQVTKLYVKGSAIRQINQTGRQLVDEVSASLRTGAQPQQTDTGRLCVGGTSYVWNDASGDLTNQYTDSVNDGEIRFVSVQDPSGTLCTSPTQGIDKAKSTDLIGTEVTPLTFSVEQQGKLWRIYLVLSTSGGNVAESSDETATGFTCRQNEFCALGDFETSVYSRGGE